MNFMIQARRLAISAYRQLPGRPFESMLVRLDKAFRQRDIGPKIAESNGGLVFELDLSQLIDNHIYYNGEFEPGTRRAFEKLVRPGMTVLDIGANIGAHTLKLAQLTGPSGHVYAFEPTEWAHRKLQRNVSLNPGFTNITLERAALSDSDESSGDYAFQSQYVVGAAPDGEQERGQVAFVKLDTYAGAHKLGRVDFIKLDVDGYETKILRGARELLKRDRPTLIVEMGDYWQQSVGDSIEALVEVLDDVGYRYERQDDAEPVEDLDGYIKSLDYKWALNVVCRAR